MNKIHQALTDVLDFLTNKKAKVTPEQRIENARISIEEAIEEYNKKPTQIIKLKLAGLSRVLNGEVGMTFIVDHFTNSGVNLTKENASQVAHVRDYRFPAPKGKPYQIWSIGPEGYEIIN